jgi:hypothetical protein
MDGGVEFSNFLEEYADKPLEMTVLRGYVFMNR